MAKPRKGLSDAAATGQRIDWLLSEALQQNDGAERGGLIADALIEAAREQAKVLAQL
jgi:hypothetical protein